MVRCRYEVCRFCNLKVCERSELFPKTVDDRCYICDAYRSWLPIFGYPEKCDCYMLSCDGCGNVLCFCSGDSIKGLCPWCKAQDRWLIIPSELFQ